MATTFLNITESSLNFKKFKKFNPKNSNLKSFWAFLLSVFIYISAFYVFNLSLSTLLCTTKFWFFISNTLIIILAADFGDFSSSKEYDQDSHEELEYVKSSTIIRPKCDLVQSLESQHVKTVRKTVSNHDHHKEEQVDEKPEEKIIDVIYSSCIKDDHRHGNHESEENKPEMIIFLNKEKNDHTQQNPNEKIILAEVKNGAHEVGRRKRTCVRSNSDKGILTAVAAAENEEKIVLQRTFSEKREEPPILEENDEYSNMSDEELNRRVEEFIRRFNRQIRLQATKNRQNFQEQLHQI